MKKKEPKVERKDSASFEEALGRLEEIVQRMEGEDLSLEESLRLFEEGVRLTRLCAKRLDEAQRKIEILTRDEKGDVRSTVVSPETFEEQIDGDHDAEGTDEAG